MRPAGDMRLTTFATSRTKEPGNVLANARLYWRISAPVVAAVAVLGVALSASGNGDALGVSVLAFDWAHNVVHLAIAAVGLYLGYATVDYALARNGARAFGVVYLALAVLGFASAGLFGIGDLVGLHLELGENVIHLALGAWAAYAGFSG